MAKPINKMNMWEAMAEETRLMALPSTPVRRIRLKECRKYLKACDKAYKAWAKVTPLHINKI